MLKRMIGVLGMTILLAACGTLPENADTATTDEQNTSTQVSDQNGKLAPLPAVQQRAPLRYNAVQQKAPARFNAVQQRAPLPRAW